VLHAVFTGALFHNTFMLSSAIKHYAPQLSVDTSPGLNVQIPTGRKAGGREAAK
jgi:hypothetical protein